MIGLGRYFGINVYLHWTFFLAMVYVGYSALQRGQNWQQVALVQIMLLLVFSFVLLHEYGHALAARRFGVRTREIVLTPVGGVAMLMGIPRSPFAEIVIALAGPAVNLFFLALFGSLDLALHLSGIGEQLLGGSVVAVVELLFQVNFVLFAFNLLPAFPMDGGRVLRALLAIPMPYEKATRVAVVIGQIMAVGFIAVGGYLGHWQLSLVGLFVLLAGSGELRRVEMENAHLRAQDEGRMQ